MMIDDQTAELLEKLEKWHSHKVKQLNTLLEHKDSPINVADIQIEPNTDLAKGMRIGVMLSLELLGKLPFFLEEESEEES